MEFQCIRCKGRGFCGRSMCPHVLRASAMFKVKSIMPGTSFSGSSLAPFIGRAGYPYVNVGILSPPEERADAWQYDAPRYWADQGMGIQDIVGFRSSLINSRQKSDIRGKTLEVAQEIGMASKPVEVEITLEERPRFALSADSVMAPHGPTARMKTAEVTGSPRIDPKVERVVADSDLKASIAIDYLYGRGFDENFLSRLLSVGTLGVKPERKLVPTRWSITATDDMISKSLVSKLRDLPTIDDHAAYFGSYLGNYYLVMLLPEIWGYELFETYMPNASWNTENQVNYSTDSEGFDGRKDYADNCAGGYYTVRLAIAEKLNSLRRQARAVVIRVITGEYSMPLGVWVTREATRKALFERPMLFDTRDLMLIYARSLCRKKFGLDISAMVQKSILLTQAKVQTKLTGF